MASKTKRSKSNDAYFKSYSKEAQKSKKIERHLKIHPNDAQSISRPQVNYAPKVVQRRVK